MSFTLGGDGPFLPPRKKQSSGLGGPAVPGTPGSTGAPTITDSSRKVDPAVQQAATQTMPTVAIKAPAFIEPDLKVRAPVTPTQLPQGTPANVFPIARQRAKNLTQAVQQAIAQSGGAVVPVANIKVSAPSVSLPSPATGRGPLAPGQSSTRSAFTPFVPGPTGPRAKIVPGMTAVGPTRTRVARGQSDAPVAAAAAPSSADLLCAMVFVLEAAKRGRGLEAFGRTLTADQVQKEAGRVMKAVKQGLDAGTISPADYAECQRIYCIKFGCEIPTAEAAPPAEQKPVETKKPRPDRTTSETGTGETSTGTGTPSEGEQAGGGGTTYTGGDTTIYLDTRSGGSDYNPRPDEEKPPKLEPEPKKSSSSTLWWLVALIAGGLLVKKLAAVKVVGAAMAGTPLIAELESDEPQEPEEAGEAEEHEE